MYDNPREILFSSTARRCSCALSDPTRHFATKMQPAFVGFAAHALAPPLQTASTHARLRRRPSPRTRQSLRSPLMMAKFQRKEENGSSFDEDQNQIEKIIPPKALPTLSTLSNSSEINLDELSQPPEQPEQLDVSAMGPGLSKEDEMFLIEFFKGVRDEFFIVEWPSFSRVVKATAIIIVSIIFAVVFVYVVDGFFYRVFQALYELQS